MTAPAFNYSKCLIASALSLLSIQAEAASLLRRDTRSLFSTTNRDHRRYGLDPCWNIHYGRYGARLYARMALLRPISR